MKKKNIVILTAGLCLAVGAGLYYGHVQKNKGMSFTINGENWSAQGTGNSAVITLPANPNTGYEWSIESVEGPVSVSLEYAEEEHDAEVVGVGGTELVTVKADGEGLSELVMKYARNWEGGETDRICRFEISSDRKGNIQSISQTELDIESETSKGATAVSIIGGADGPTSIFLAGKLGDNDGENSDIIPMVMIDGDLYYLIGESDIDGRCGNMDGEIAETVDGSEVPVKDGQSNFGAGYGYQYVDGNQIDVYMPYGNPDEERWMRFLKIGTEMKSDNFDSDEEEVNHFPGVSMTLTEADETGAVVSLLNTTDLEVQFGDDYDLQVFENGVWKSLPYLIEDWCFNSIAYSMPKDQPAEWKVNWETFHGALQPGHYRLVKAVMDFRGAGDYTDYNLAVEFDISERADANVLLSEPPVLRLQDALSSTYEKFEVKSGNYTWFCKNGNEDEMKGGIACGSGPLDEVKGRESLKVPRYNKLDSVPYTLSWENEPDYLTVREYSTADIGNADVAPVSEDAYDEVQIFEIKPDCIYEIIAKWEEDQLAERGFYGEAAYVVVTE